MFKCQSCKEFSAPNEKANFVVAEVRHRVYTRFKTEKEVTVGQGTEIVREIKVCAKCAKERHNAQQNVG